MWMLTIWSNGRTCRRKEVLHTGGGGHNGLMFWFDKIMIILDDLGKQVVVARICSVGIYKPWIYSRQFLMITLRIARCHTIVISNGWCFTEEEIHSLATWAGAATSCTWWSGVWSWTRGSPPWHPWSWGKQPQGNSDSRTCPMADPEQRRIWIIKKHVR